MNETAFKYTLKYHFKCPLTQRSEVWNTADAHTVYFSIQLAFLRQNVAFYFNPVFVIELSFPLIWKISLITDLLLDTSQSMILFHPIIVYKTTFIGKKKFENTFEFSAVLHKYEIKTFWFYIYIIYQLWEMLLIYICIHIHMYVQKKNSPLVCRVLYILLCS